MAYLISCYVCGNKVSNDAKTCPYCGDPYILENRKKEIYNICPFMSTADKKESCPKNMNCMFYIPSHPNGYKTPNGDMYGGCLFFLMMMDLYKIQEDISTLMKAIKIKPKGEKPKNEKE
jgi:hypothetical protein